MPEQTKDVTLDLTGDNIESVKVKVIYGDGNKKTVPVEEKVDDESYKIKPTGYEMARRHLAKCLWCGDKPGYHTDVRYKKLREEAQSGWSADEWDEHRRLKGDISPSLMTYGYQPRNGGRGKDNTTRKQPERLGVQSITRHWIIDHMTQMKHGKIVVAETAGLILGFNPELHLPSIKACMSEAFLAMVMGNPMLYSYSHVPLPIRSKVFKYEQRSFRELTIEQLTQWIEMRNSSVHRSGEQHE